MRFLLVAFIFVFVLVLGGGIEESHGRKILYHDDDDDDRNLYNPFVLKNFFSTKTKYWYQKHPIDTYQTQRRFRQLSTIDSSSSSSSLQLVQVNQVTRHGSRYPTKGNMEKIQNFVKKIQSTMEKKNLPQWLQTYELPYNLSMEGELAPAGAEEVYEFGRRTRLRMIIAKKKFPFVFSKEKFILEHTFKSRTKQSAIAFARGFFDNPDQVEYTVKTKGDDLTLRFYDHCRRYKEQVKSNPNTMIQNEKYLKSNQMEQNIRTLRDALGLKEVELNAEDSMTIFSACAFDLALFNKETQWCSLLKEDSIRSMDFADDLETFYTVGYGYEINYEMAAVLLKDIFNSMQAFAQNKTQVIGNFRFAHAETLLPLHCLLGYRKDPRNLMADFSWQQIQQRQFFSSKLVPFAANMQFKLYVHENSEYFVQILVNEKEIPIPGCQNKIFCSLQELETLWAKYLYDFNFQQLCSL